MTSSRRPSASVPCPECALTFTLSDDGRIPRHFRPFKRYVEYCPDGGSKRGEPEPEKSKVEPPHFKTASKQGGKECLPTPKPADVSALPLPASKLPSIRVRRDGNVRCPGCRQLFEVNLLSPRLPRHRSGPNADCAWSSREFEPQLPPEVSARDKAPRKVPSKFKQEAERLVGLDAQQRQRFKRNIQRYSVRSEEEVRHEREKERRRKADAALSSAERNRRAEQKRQREEERRRERNEPYMRGTGQRIPRASNGEGGVSVRTYSGGLPGLGKRR